MKKNTEKRLLVSVFLALFMYGSSAQTLVAQATPVAPQELLTLEELIREAEQSNPELRAAAEELRAARLRVRPAGALPDPTINFGEMNVGSVVPFTTLGEEGFSEIYVGVSQEFPFLGKRGLRENVSQKEADAEFWNYEFTRLRVLAEIKVAYYDLFYHYRTLDTLRKDMRLLETFEETAGALYRVGTATQADVLRAQTEISLLQDQIEVAEQRRGVAEVRINTLLNRLPDTSLAPPASFEKATIRHSLEELRQLASERFPLLRRQGEMVQARQYGLELAEKERYPDFGVMFAYHNRGALRDYWVIGGTARIPLYFNRKQKYEIEEAGARLSASRERYDNIRTSLQFSLKDYYLEATTSERLLRLFEETIIPQETLTLEATSASYQVGEIDFLSVIDSLLKLTNDEIRYYEYLTSYQKALARLEPLVGVELTR